MSNEKFNYTYTALSEEEKEQIRYIRQKYQPKNERDKKEQVQNLTKLHRKIVNSTTVPPLVLGIVGCMTFGLGLTFILEWSNFPIGVILGVIGGIAMIFAYPLYRYIDNKMKQKYSDEILKLSDSLLEGEE